MKLSEILGWPDKQKEYFGVNTVQAGEAFGHNTALESCDREIDRDALAKQLYETCVGHTDWEMAPDSVQLNYIKKAKFFISTMPTWLKPTERK